MRNVSFVWGVSLLLAAGTASATPKDRGEHVVVIPPTGETSQISADDIVSLWEVLARDTAETLGPLGFAVVQPDKKLLKALDKSDDLDDLAQRTRARLIIFGEASSAKDRHSIALRAYDASVQKIIAATDINGKALTGLKRSWSAKRAAFFTDVQEALRAKSAGIARNVSTNDPRQSAAEAEAQQRLGKQQSKDLKKLCDAGEADACTARGYMYYQGKGVRRNRGTAISLLEKGCEKGDGTGCLLAGAMYSSGDGVRPDPDKADILVARGCDLGSKTACKFAKKAAPAPLNAY